MATNDHLLAVTARRLAMSVPGSDDRVEQALLLHLLRLASPSEPAGRQTFFSPHKGGSGLSPFPARQEGLRPANSLSATCAVCSEAQPVSDRESGGCNVRHPAGLMAGDPRHQ